ncbi:hypothetical protein ACJMK2_028665 [Sinanodonta woodiana]|uniref:Uncharacterized protein n=1 Tax=Sinanodonta woodiana TaxID=1069815 RepID=A0ABD3X7T5_SINWO
MLAEYKKEEDEYNTAVKNLEPLKTKTQELLKTTEQQNEMIQKLQKIINDNNETISSLKKIKNLSIFDQIKSDLVDDLANGKVENKNLDAVKGTKFDSNWNPQFPDFIGE